ncbi:hypothetical protein [Kribbella jiaozuonensis]|uniref:Uncharacterized protein n=1 Tax=Kribbella jiaozuonensis TaxID=2575441 RepID=A0A4U3LWG7_9ACTN|nr:hypothetical protein [Kribbella jiaozuonensis]TKK79176.1 hypothetical protein FDA38_12150 [Kribbella jiaozuonensis]TKK83246.1 hypothetical protein FDA38_11105 [Kribbella jiaozuonensis]
MTPENRSEGERDYSWACMATYRHNSWAVSYCTKPKDPQHKHHVAHDAGRHYLFGWTEESNSAATTQEAGRRM